MVEFEYSATIRLRAMVLSVLRERRIMLPTSRIYWYVEWLGIPASKPQLRRLLRIMVKGGELERIKYDNVVYWRLVKRRL